jgi:hypothetical protein
MQGQSLFFLLQNPVHPRHFHKRRAQPQNKRAAKKYASNHDEASKALPKIINDLN